MKELPIACSLGQTDLAGRLAQIESIGAEALLSRERRADRHLLRFRRDAEIERRLDAIVAAEARCCPFLQLEIIRERQALVLEISPPAGGEREAAGLAEAFAAGDGPPGEAVLVSSETDRAFATHETEGEVHTRQGQHG